MATFQTRLEEALTMKEISPAELSRITGIGEGAISQYRKGAYKASQRNLEKIANALSVSIPWLMGADESMSATLPDTIMPLPKMRKVPLLGTIACGEPILAQENIEDEVDMPENVHADFCLRCKGESMIGARIQDGDIVYIHQQPDVENGEIAAVIIDDEATLKRVYKYPNKVVLQPENPQYAPLVYVGTELETIRIIGKAVAFLSNVV